jgi:hypothetical protein
VLVAVDRRRVSTPTLHVALRGSSRSRTAAARWTRVVDLQQAAVGEQVEMKRREPLADAGRCGNRLAGLRTVARADRVVDPAAGGLGEEMKRDVAGTA